MRGRVALVSGITCLAVALPTTSAWAGPLPGASTGSGEPVATVENTIVTAGSTVSDAGGGGGGTGPRCTYEVMPGPAQYELVDADDVSHGTSATGVWYFRACYDDAGRETSFAVVPAADAGGGTLVVDPRVLMEDALAKLTIPDPAMVANPPVGSRSLVTVPTWLWLTPAYWQPRSATASAGGASATVIAEPVLAAWDMGDGSVVPCAGPGTPWSPGMADTSATCAHTYARSSSSQPADAYPVTVTVTWDVSWTSSVPGAGGDLDDLTRSASAQIPVAEIQALVQQ